MKILSLRANFGRLSGETLDLSDGLNVITLPNESGKSTWSQFILAMFYGIDTSERAKAGTLPAKTKFKPWSGTPMQGSMDLEWNGRCITIERSGTGRGLMNNFRAYETESGLSVPELTAENCGRMLLGVERSVFERSAFIRQSGLAVTQDSALEQRLQALVTTGDEGASFSDAEQILKDRRNYLGRSRTGQLDHRLAELNQVRAQQQELEELGQSVYKLNQDQQQLEVEKADISQRLHIARAREAAEKLQQLSLAETRVAEAATALEQAKRTCAQLPGEQALTELELQLDSLPQPPTPPGTAPTAPQLPDALQLMDEPQIRRTVEADLAALDSSAEAKKAPLALLILSVLLSIAGIALVFFNLPLGLGLTVIGQVLLQLGLHQQRKISAANRQREQIQADILDKYGVADRAAIVQLSERCCAELSLYTRQLEQHQAAQRAYFEAQQAYDTDTAAILSQLRMFCSISDLSEARSALREVRAKHEALRRAESVHNQAEEHYVNLKTALGELSAPDPLLLQQEERRSPADLERELATNAQRLQQLRSTLDQMTGRRSAVGDPDALTAREEALTAQCEAISLHVQALDTALAALTVANNEVQTRISPAMAQKASAYLAFLTDGRYDKVQLGTDFSAAARLTGDVLPQSLAYLSAGTADQLYLSVRLAICALALDEHYAAPLILDDALAFFDDARCAKALELLQQLSHKRQILLFTCQKRESALLK